MLSAEDGWAKIKSMGTNPDGHIFAVSECDLQQPISPSEDFSFRAYIRCQDGDPSGSCSATYIELMTSNDERVAMLMWDDSQASSGHGGICFRNEGGDIYDNDPTGFGTLNPTFDNGLEIRREGTTWIAYLDGVQQGSSVDFSGERTATKVQIWENKYKNYGYRDGRMDYIQIQKAGSEPPVGDLIAHYPYNGNANDESGNGYHGTVHGASLTTDQNGNSNSAYYFDGVNDYINISSVSSHISTTHTRCGWIKTTQNSNIASAIFGTGNDENTKGCYFSLLDGK